MPSLTQATCRARLTQADHGVLGTLHADRGVDLVPVVFAVVDDRIVIPVDRVKAKTTMRLGRLANIERDPRVSVLVDHHDPDWSRLWWVRASGRATHHDAVDAPEARAALASRYPAYLAVGSIDRVIVVTVDRWTGWRA